ncbi:MAG: RsmB/NOP family class I SAM-dependent RNA methyltransferase [Acidobacteriota bacterium]
MDLSSLERYRPLIDDWSAFADAVQAPLPVTVWANTLRLDRPGLERVLAADGIDSTPLEWYPRGLRVAFGTRPGKTVTFVAGYCHIQEEVSMLPIHLLDPQPGERVLDLCSAPGNKSIQAAVHMAGRGLVFANDVNQRRLVTVTRNVERLGLTNVAVSRWDGSSLPQQVGLFDRVLADVPCSCEGTTRKNTEILWRAPMHANLPGSQTALLRKAVQKCRPGGRVVYSTCTYAPEENEAVVDAVLRESPGLRVLPAGVPGLRSAPGVTSWEGQDFLPELAGTLRLWPHHNDTGGFFIAVLERPRDD